MMSVKDWILLNEEDIKTIYEQSKETDPIFHNEEELVKKAELFKALGDETRLRIIGLLAVRDSCMCEIVAALNGANSTISHHLKQLERGGVISSRKEGKFTIFHLNKAVLTYINL